MLRPHWWGTLMLTVGLIVLGTLALVGGSVHAQSPADSGGPTLSPAQQSIKADLGPYYKMDARASRVGQNGQSDKALSTKNAPDLCTGWNVVSSPDPSADYNQLYGTAALSPKDIWAVGQYCASDCNTQDEVDRALIEHWNGSAWSVVPSPDLDSTSTFLSSVAAISPKDVWAAGDYFNGTHIQTLTEHWNGSAWSVVPSPNPGNANNYLNGVAASSTNDVWAVGTDHVDLQEGPSLETLILHWNGSAWSVVSSPNPYPGSARNEFTGVTVVNRNDAWAAGWSCGSYLSCGDGVTNPQAMIEHWNGSSWTIAPSPNPGPVSMLEALSASQANDIWAVGNYCTTVDCSESDPFIEHFNGTAWSIVSSPIPASTNSTYWGVLAINPNNAWAVGSFSSDGATWTNLVSHWDGTSWSQVTVASPGAYDNDLRSLAAIGPNNVWVVGDYDNGSGEQTQIQHFDGPCK